MREFRETPQWIYAIAVQLFKLFEGDGRLVAFSCEIQYIKLLMNGWRTSYTRKPLSSAIEDSILWSQPSLTPNPKKIKKNSSHHQTNSHLPNLPKLCPASLTTHKFLALASASRFLPSTPVSAPSTLATATFPTASHLPSPRL